MSDATMAAVTQAVTMISINSGIRLTNHQAEQIARAAISANEQMLRVHGKVVVPRKPTAKMLDAGNRASILDEDELAETWSAMVWAGTKAE